MPAKKRSNNNRRKTGPNRPRGGSRPGGGPRGPGGPGAYRPIQPPRHEEDDKEEAIEVEGMIIAVLAGTMFRAELPNKHVVLAHISGKMRKRFIRLVVGDRVKMDMSPYDNSKGRITYRIG